ncbi:TPA: nucleotide sugar dehydrogenase [Streptococcus agalactiae]
MVTYEELRNRNASICVIGLGYVGFPLLKLLSKKYRVIGYDSDYRFVAKLSAEAGNINKNYELTNDPKAISNCKVFIVTVPTPTNEDDYSPNYSYIKSATATIASHMGIGTLVIYESTVGPGTTVEKCVPLLEKISGLKCGKDFSVGYSPERINPGDTINTLEQITKLVSGFDLKTTNLIKQIYDNVMITPTYPVSDIKIAELSKLLENIQRDVNIALLNEFSEVLSNLNINVQEVLEAARTKWNFVNFRPGIVGGHCIGVDINYYLEFVSKNNLTSKLIGTARDINEEHVEYIFEKIQGYLENSNAKKICAMGISYKENVSDIRNSKALKIINHLQDSKKFEIDIFDPLQDKEEMKQNKISLIDIKDFDPCQYDCLLLFVAHRAFKEFLDDKINFDTPVINLTEFFETSKNSQYQ